MVQETESQDAQPHDAPGPQLFSVEWLPEKLRRQDQESLEVTDKRLAELDSGIENHLKEASVMRVERDTLRVYRADLQRRLKPRGRGAKKVGGQGE